MEASDIIRKLKQPTLEKVTDKCIVYHFKDVDVSSFASKILHITCSYMFLRRTLYPWIVLLVTLWTVHGLLKVTGLSTTLLDT